MRRIIFYTQLALAWAALAASGAEAYTITLTQKDIQSQIEKKFPVTEEGGFYNVTLSGPKVDLKEGSDRIGIIVNALVEALGSEGTGVIHIDGALKYVRETGEFLLSGATARAVEIEGMSDLARGKVAELATEILRDYFDKNPIYKIKGNSPEESLLKSALKSVAVKDGKLQIELGLP